MTANDPWSSFALDVYWASGRRGDPALEAHLVTCEDCRRYLARLDAMVATEPPLSIPAARPRAKRWTMPALGVVALAAGALLFLSRPRPTPPDDYVGTKGTPAVQLLVHRDRDTRIWDGRSPVHPGDSVALRVACEGLTHLVVAAPGPRGWARLSGAPCTSSDELAPFTLRVDEEPGSESLAVVLSRDEMSDAALEQAIGESRRSADTWVVTFVLPKETEMDR